jgi:phage terminase Nu1 subunit (DNA packaging protein)
MVNGKHSGVNVPSQAAIGRALNLSPAAITKLKKQGMPVDSVASAQAWREVRQNVAARKPMPAASAQPNPIAGRVGGDDFRAMVRAHDAELRGLESDEDHDAARTRLRISEANLSEMKEAELRGKLLEKAGVDAAIFEIARAMRDGLTNCAKRIAAEVAAMGKADDCEAVIEREHRALLESMTHQITVRLGTIAPTVAA